MRRFVPLVLSLFLVAGCSGSGAAAPPVPPVVPSVRPSPTPSPTPTPSTLPAVGSTQETRDDDSVSKISALRIRSLKPISKALSRPGHEYLAFDVKLCVPENTREPVTAFAAPWMLSFADDSTTMASIASPSWFDVPIYPQVQAVRPGDCVRGWIPFEIPEDSEPRTLLYQPSTGNTLEWRLE